MTTNNLQIRWYSGYIRNWQALCDELSLAKDLSREAREEAILKAAYQKWGMEMTAHLYGAFAFALYDDEQQKLYVVRDQVGQKQMFYTVADGELLCSGDINEIAADPRVEKRLNKRMLQQYLFYGYPIGDETFYEGVYKLCPGHYAVWDGKNVTVTRYWQPVFTPDHSKTDDEWAEEIANIVDEILSEERADTALPYKESFLSGGVDSSYLLAASDAQYANTVGYAETGFDESTLARDTAAVLGKGFRAKQIAPRASAQSRSRPMNSLRGSPKRSTRWDSRSAMLPRSPSHWAAPLLRSTPRWYIPARVSTNSSAATTPTAVSSRPIGCISPALTSCPRTSCAR